MRALAAALPLAIATLGVSCSERRDEPLDAPVFDVDVAPVLERACVRCHGADAPAAGWSATSYLGAIACVSPSGAPATLPASDDAPILSALQDDTHHGLLDPTEKSVVERWVRAGAPAFKGIVHPAGIIDPRSSDWHGAILRGKRWSQMLDGTDAEACGRCHEGTPGRVEGVTSPAPGAPACTTCHDQPAGVLACGTCHGDGKRDAPPRNLCFFPEDANKAGAHAEHLQKSALHDDSFTCTTCHPGPPEAVIGGAHGNGTVDIAFDPAAVVGATSYDRDTKTCTVSCHDQGGKRARPRWNDTAPATCNDCHTSPPANHFPGPCTKCHAEPNADGTSLASASLHLNGHVDLGDGSGKCGACHGKGDSPLPSTGAHAAHADPKLTVPVDCSSCHAVPSAVISPGHLDGIVEVAFSGRATDRGAAPIWDGTSCSSVACHGAKLVDPPLVTPIWTDTSGAAAACGACHPIPPTQHTPSMQCGQGICHGPEIKPDAMGFPYITPFGRTLHVNGVIDHAP